MSCGAGHSRRTANAVRRRGTNRRVTKKVTRKTVSRKPVVKAKHRAANRRPKPVPVVQHHRSKASVTASKTARAHAHATASAHARATASAHARAAARARARAGARAGYQAYLACLKKKRKAATVKITKQGTPRVWKPVFRGKQRRRKVVPPIFR